MLNKPANVLIFDDDFESMQYLQQHLEEVFNWTVELTAEQSILERLKRERFDLIVVDLMIQPKTEKPSGIEVANVHFDGLNWQATGREFIRCLRLGEFSSDQGTPADVPVILLSAIADSAETSTENELLTSVKVIEKPFRLESLVQAILSAIQPK